MKVLVRKLQALTHMEILKVIFFFYHTEILKVIFFPEWATLNHVLTWMNVLQHSPNFDRLMKTTKKHLHLFKPLF